MTSPVILGYYLKHTREQKSNLSLDKTEMERCQKELKEEKNLEISTCVHTHMYSSSYDINAMEEIKL